MHLRRFLCLAALGVCLSVPSRAVPKATDTGVAALMHRAAGERKRGDYASAAATYRQVLEQAPRLFEAHLFLADTLRKRRLDAEAEQEFLAARRIHPADPLPYAGLASLRRDAFRFPDALSILREGLAAVPREDREPLIVAEGTFLRQSGDAASALRVLEQGAKEHPSSPRIREALALSLEAQGRQEEAVEAWTKTRDLAPEDGRIRIGLEEARNLALRLQKAEAGTKLPQGGSKAWEELARVSYLARRFPAAADAALKAMGREKGRNDLLLLRALSLEKTGEYGEAETQLRRIPPRAAEHLLAAYHRAYLARLRGDEEAEEKIWSEAVEIHPEDPTARLMLVLVWKRKGVLEDRIGDLRRRARKTGEPASLRVLEGIALEEAGRDDEAAEVYAILFLAEPLDPESSARLAGLLAFRPALLKRWLENETERRVREGIGADPARHLLLARLFQASGGEKAAEKELRETADRFPARTEPHMVLAVLIDASEGDPTEAVREAARAVELAPESPWVRLQKGVLLLRAGDASGAIREGEKAVRLAPDLPEGHQLLGAAQRAGGDFPGAVAELTRALVLDPTDSLGVVRFQLSLALAAQGKRPEARSALEGDVPPFPELIYRLAWSFARRTFLDRSFSGQDWRAWRDRLPDPGAGENGAYAAVAEMLASLRDPYTRVRGLEETEAIYLAAHSAKLETDRTGTPTLSSRSVLAEELGGNLGYIRLTTFSDPSARETIRRALEKMAERDGLVLDLRGNAGGLSEEADAIAGLLLDPGEETGQERTRTGQQTRRTTQTHPLMTRKPLVILTDRRTGSAAEKLAAGLQGAGRATVVGEETFGKGAAQMSRLLPGGGMVLVTAVENLTRAGKPIQERGVTPDVAGEDAPLEKAKEILRKAEEPKPPR